MNWTLNEIFQQPVNHLMPRDSSKRAESWGYDRYLKVCF